MTDYIHDYDDHLVNNLHHTIELVDGIPHLRVNLGADNITVTGSVNIATEIKVNNTEQQSIPVHLTDDPIGVTGQFWQATQPVSIASMPTTPVTGQFWQATQPVSIASLPNITGSVSVSNFPGIQAVSGNFYPETQPVSIASMPTTPVTGTFWPSTQNVSGTVELGATTLEALENTTVNIGTMPEVEIKNDSANPIPVTGTVNIGNTTIQTSVVAEGTDAFNRLRVSEPMTLADYHHVGGENPEMTLKVSGSGAGSADPQKSAYVLSLGTGNGDYVIHQSRMYHHYLPGKSQLINSSFCMGAYRTNTVKRIGYFDDYNGIFFEQAADGTLAWVERKTVSGVTSDTRVTQANWNKNTCNAGIAGATVGASNFGQNGTWTLDITKTQLIMIDFQWLGVGRLRVGFVHNGAWVVAHEFYHSNTLTTVYWNQPSLPIRCEMRNTGTAVGTHTMDQICSSVMSEGGYIETGLVNTISSALTGRTIVNGGDKLPVVAIRLKNSFNAEKVRGIVRAMQASLIITNAPVYMELMRYDSHTQVTGGAWVSKDSNSIVEYNITATASTGGLAVSGQFLAAAASKNITASGDIINPVTNKRGFITQNYDSTESECYAIVVTALGSGNNLNIDCYASLQWSETR